MRTAIFLLLSLLVTVSCTHPVQKKDPVPLAAAAPKTQSPTAVQTPPQQPDSVVIYPDTFYYKVPKDKIPAFSAIMSGEMGQVSVDMWKDQVASINLQLRAQLKTIKNPNATPSTKTFK